MNRLRQADWSAWLAAAAGLALTLAVFWPGFMSSDSAEQWLQARSGQYTSVHPPLMAFTWALSERLWPGPGGLFAAHATLYWLGLALLARGLSARALPQALVVLGIGLWPPVWGTLAHLWKDVPMAAFALIGVGLLALELRRPARWRLGLALLAFAAACAYRHNALPLVLPFLLHITIRLGCARWPQRLLATAALAVAVAVVAALPARHPSVTARQVWPVTAIWDLAAVSLATQRLRIPDDWRAPDLTLDELRTAFRPWSNTTVFDTGKLLISLYVDPTPAQSASLRAAWWSAWRDEPGAMLAHRLRLTALLFGLHPQPAPVGLALAPGWVSLPENPPLRIAPSMPRDAVARGLLALAATPLYDGWCYLLGLLALATQAWRRRPHPLFWPVVASAALLAAPLPLLAPSAEFRYLLWLLLATGVALALRLAVPATAASTAGAARPPA